MKDTTKRVFHNAKIEINRILSALDIPESFQELILTNFKRGYSEFKPSTKYRSVEKLVPAVLYYSLKDQNVPISVRKLLEVSKIERSEFNHFRIQVRRYMKTRDSIKRQLFISQRLLEIKDHFNLGMEFVFYAKKIMCRLWELIKNTTDNVIAGVSSSITVLCYYNEQVSINAICKLLGIRMSTIQFQVEHRIFEKLRVEGFSTLKKSTNIIKTVMEQLGLFEKEEIGKIIGFSADTVRDTFPKLSFLLTGIENLKMSELRKEARKQKAVELLRKGIDPRVILEEYFKMVIADIYVVKLRFQEIFDMPYEIIIKEYFSNSNNFLGNRF